jgi:hypothetical protein
MQEEARAAGIRFDPDKEIKKPNEPVHISVKLPDSRARFLSGGYRLVSWRRFYRPIFAWDENQGDIACEKQTVDETVLQRYAQDLEISKRGYARQHSLGNKRDNLIAQCLEKLQPCESLMKKTLQ